MAIIISTMTGGGDIGTTKVDFGQVAPSASSVKDLYIRNTYSNEITDARFYFDELQGTYDGDGTASDDFTELKAWGDGAGTDGVFLNQNASTPSWSQLKTNSLDSDTYNETLSTDSGVAAAGKIAGGGTEEAHIQEKFAVPAGETTGGSRQWSLIFAYSYTS